MDFPNQDYVIEDKIFISTAPGLVFRALTDAQELAQWWPAAAESEPQPGGQLVTHFVVYKPETNVSFPFYEENLDFILVPQSNGTYFTVRHCCSSKTAVHVAQCWGFLKANLKAWVEYKLDFREKEKGLA